MLCDQCAEGREEGEKVEIDRAVIHRSELNIPDVEDGEGGPHLGGPAFVSTRCVAEHVTADS